MTTQLLRAQVITSRFKPIQYEKLIVPASNNEVTIFDSNGDAKAYITEDDLTIYLFSGKPVAYLYPSRGAFNIYGFNGKHLGWFEEGIIRNHKGNAVGFIEGAVNIYTNYEPYKSHKEYKPYKSYREYVPNKPYYTNKFSSVPLNLFLSSGIQQ